MQSTDAQDIGIGLTGVMEKLGAHLSYMCLARTAVLSSSLFHLTQAAAARPRSCAAACLRSRRHSRTRLHAAVADPRPAFATAARTPPARDRTAPLQHRPCTTAACAASADQRRHHCYSCTTYRPRSSIPRRSRNHSTFSPSARQVLDVLPELLLSRRVRVPHTVSQDGSRKEEGEGGRGREAHSQADSCREGGREGRDGGQGRRGAGVRSCSSVRDSGAASQGQRQRQRYGQGPRCQGLQGHYTADRGRFV